MIREEMIAKTLIGCFRVPSKLAVVVTCVCCWFGMQVSNQVQAQQVQPNIIYIFVDDLSSGMVGFTNSDTLVKTPNIDALATGGLQFTQAYANAVCSPSRGSLYTGYHLGHTINDRNVINFRSEDIMPGEMVKQVGYATAVYGKWGYGGTTGQQFVTDLNGDLVLDGNGNRIREGVESLRENPVINNQNTLPTTHGYDDFLGYLDHVQAHRFFIDPLWQADPTSSNTMSYFATGNNAGDGVTNTFEGYTDDFHTYRAMDFITESVAVAAPFMLQMHFNSPHPSYDPGEKLTTDFAGNVRPWDQEYQGLGLSLKQRQLGAMITRLDEHIGALVDHLSDPNGDGNDADSVLENTVIMFTSDNGGEPTDNITTAEWNELGGNKIYGDALRGGKRDLYEGGTRVPFFAYWAGTIAPNQFTGEIIDLADFMPTLADLAGMDPPIGLDGVSYAGLLTGEGMTRRRPYHVWEHHERDGPDPDSRRAEWSVLKDNFKLIHFTNGSEDLYNLNTDPGETQTLDLNTFADLRAEFQAIAVAEGVNQSSNGYSAQHVDWIGGDQGSTTSQGNWSNYDSLQEVWVSVIENDQASDSSIEFADADFLGIEVKGDSALQTIRVNPSSELVVRNELRIEANGRANVDAGTLNCLRWLDVKSGGQLTGVGNVAGQLYNWGTIAPGLPSDLAAPDGEGGGGDTDPGDTNPGGEVDPGIAFFDPAAGNGDEPTENVIFDAVFGEAIQTLIDTSGNAGARGGTFSIGSSATAVEIGGVTIQSNGSQSFSSGDEVTVVVFSGNEFAGIDQQNITPAGLATAPGITLLYEETFPLPASIPNNNFVIFGFANSVSVNGGEALGMMVFTDASFSQREGNNNGGGRLQYRQGSDISPSASRDMRFSILGSTTTTGDGGGDIGGEPVDVEINETGVLNLAGDFFHQAGGALQMQVAAANDADQLVVDGTMVNEGSLEVELLADYQPQDGDSITLVESDSLIGDFASVNIQGVPAGFEADVQISGGDVVLTMRAVDPLLLGDANLDGIVNFLDISPFIMLLSSGNFLDQADIDRNGKVDFLDISPFIGILAGP